MTEPAAGWYADPEGHQQWRYWDGAHWTSHTAPYETPAPPTGAAPATPAPLPAAPVATAPAPPAPVAAESQGGGSLLSRFRKSDDEKAAHAQYEQLLSGMAGGTVELAGLGDRLRAAATAAGLRDRKASKFADQGFRGLVERLLDDDLITQDEEDELFAAGAAIGVDNDVLNARFPDLVQRIVIAGANADRLAVIPDPHLMVKRGEQVHMELPARLMKEVVHREFRGGSSGVSFKVAPGVRFRTGGFRGRSVITGTSIEPADTGLLSVTSQRTVFQGSRKTQECRYDKLVGMDPYVDGVRIAVSNRQTPSLYGVSNGLLVAAVVNAAVQRTLD